MALSFFCRCCGDPLPSHRAGLCDDCEELGDTEVVPTPLTPQERAMLERINRDLGEAGA